VSADAGRSFHGAFIILFQAHPWYGDCFHGILLHRPKAANCKNGGAIFWHCRDKGGPAAENGLVQINGNRLAGKIPAMDVSSQFEHEMDLKERAWYCVTLVCGHCLSLAFI
jgi:hypothetical protein